MSVTVRDNPPEQGFEAPPVTEREPPARPTEVTRTADGRLLLLLLFLLVGACRA
ncbi:hypothetical protein P3T37_002825 [Kitasatospora sp. MAA4]|uniref:hypothetical protein n=1 Tax=Kitasatospora sp. MAA4 TaxID=3035093 RepID=UPI00247380DE|nr:hypothetical protein [Kitasatospora sp. MAA4]MDH6133429.1 hypothetical protein [Kitasatospora sp. MAA4]